MDTLILTFPCKPGLGKELLKTFEVALNDTRAIKGCLSVVTYVSADNPDDIVLFEEWDQKSSQESYMKWRVETGMPEALAPILAGPLREQWLVSQSTENLGSVVHDFVQHFRNRDIEGCRNLLIENFVWFNPDGSKVLEGRETFLEAITEFWLNNPDVKNASSRCIEVGNLVTHTETFTGFADGRTEENIWVYEFEGRRLKTMYGHLVKA
jgi:quinol monooxygenase YgiN